MLFFPGFSFGLFRNLLVLGRVSNLPTVWSNCVAGWWLGGAGSISALLLLAFAATLLYLGGMYLNDAFDVEFDRQHRMERPIPSGAISLWAVWILGTVWLLLGLLLLIPFGKLTLVLGVLLALAIVVYDAVHKMITFSPVIMAACRFLLYLLAASIAFSGVTGIALWSALALAGYIVGLSYLARRESTGAPWRAWPAYLLAAPIVLALIVNAGPFRFRGILLSTVLAAWIVICLRHAFSRTKNIGRTVSGLLAGIVLVDWLAVANGPVPLDLTFILLFVAALVFQRFIPAT